MINRYVVRDYDYSTLHLLFSQLLARLNLEVVKYQDDTVNDFNRYEYPPTFRLEERGVE